MSRSEDAGRAPPRITRGQLAWAGLGLVAAVPVVAALVVLDHGHHVGLALLVYLLVYLALALVRGWYLRRHAQGGPGDPPNSAQQNPIRPRPPSPAASGDVPGAAPPPR